MKWKTIDTAPRECLVVTPSKSIYSAYRTDRGLWLAEDPAGGGMNVLEEKPTHWMPLPKLPTNKE